MHTFYPLLLFQIICDEPYIVHLAVNKKKSSVVFIMDIGMLTAFFSFDLSQHYFIYNYMIYIKLLT